MGSKSSKNSSDGEATARKYSREAPFARPECFCAINKVENPAFLNLEHSITTRNELFKVRGRMEEEKNLHGENSNIFKKLALQESILRKNNHFGSRPTNIDEAIVVGIKQAEYYHLDVQTRKY